METRSSDSGKVWRVDLFDASQLFYLFEFRNSLFESVDYASSPPEKRQRSGWTRTCRIRRSVLTLHVRFFRKQSIL